MRRRYFNGDELTMQAANCDSCCPTTINGVFCHERGCPDAWRDEQVECWVCGYDFQPTEQHQRVCPDCEPEN
jgi:hypothetical protein